MTNLPSLPLLASSLSETRDIRRLSVSSQHLCHPREALALCEYIKTKCKAAALPHFASNNLIKNKANPPTAPPIAAIHKMDGPLIAAHELTEPGARYSGGVALLAGSNPGESDDP